MKEYNSPIPCDTARVINVVETTLTRRGIGNPDDPIRIIRQYWSTEGELLAEVDPTHDIEPKGPALGDRAEILIIMEPDGAQCPALRVNDETFKFGKRYETHHGASEYCRQLKQALRKAGCRLAGEKNP